MAYIYKRGKSWAYRAYAGKDPTTGKDIQKGKSGFATKKDAQLAAALFERKFHKGDYIQPSGMTVAELYQEWERHYIVDTKVSRLRTRKIALKHIINDYGCMAIQKLTKNNNQ